MTSRLLRPSHWVPLVLMVGLAALPWVAQALNQPFYIALVARMLAYAIAASALNLALGYCGLVGFGHALFLGIGSYAVALPVFHGADNGLLHVGIALAACGLTAFITGLVSLRTTGVGFIMITLAFAQMGYYLFVSLKQYGGDDGLTITAPSRLGPFSLGSATGVYAAAFIVLALQTWWMHRLRIAPFGMVLRAIRQNPRRVAAVGFPVLPYRLAAYVISAMLCGLAGVLLANLNAFASPAALSWSTSGELIVIVVLGGIGTAFGPLLGTVAFLGLEEVLKLYTEHWMVIFGPVIVILALVGRTGLMGALARLDRPPAPAADTPGSASTPSAQGVH